MTPEKLKQVRSRTVVLPQANIDTDQIIPARFLKTTTRTGLGQFAFADWRQDPAFALNQPGAKGCAVLVAGPNFACGSSREHAPWALLDYGFRAVVSSSIADIFRNNAVKNGLVPVLVSEAAHGYLLAHPGSEVTIDLESLTISYDGGARSEAFPLDPFARYCLLEGVDELGFLLAQDAAISAFERARADTEAA